MRMLHRQVHDRLPHFSSHRFLSLPAPPSTFQTSLFSGKPQNVLSTSRINFNHAETLSLQNFPQPNATGRQFSHGTQRYWKKLNASPQEFSVAFPQMAPARSSIVFLPGGRLKGASMDTIRGGLSWVFFIISSLEKSKDVSALKLLRRQKPVGLVSAPAKSKPTIDI